MGAVGNAEITERDVVAHLESSQPAARHGWFWEASRSAVAGWFHAQYRGPNAHDVPRGFRQFVGPGFALLALSTDQDIHHPDVISEVLAELGSGTVDTGTLSREIFDRTLLRRTS